MHVLAQETHIDWIALSAAAFTLLLALATLALVRVTAKYARRAESASARAKADAERANDIATGQAETQLRAAITASQQPVLLYAKEIAAILKGRKSEDLQPDEKSVYDVAKASFDTAVEQQLNTYEDACAKYRDNKIDKRRFKQIYVSEIRNLAESRAPSMRNLMHPRDTSRYKAIWAVYDEWNDLEANPGA